MGDVAQSSSDFGYMTIRNFFETSHAKGPQDGAGANLNIKLTWLSLNDRYTLRV